jgi:hypothetical protein
MAFCEAIPSGQPIRVFSTAFKQATMLRLEARAARLRMDASVRLCENAHLGEPVSGSQR